VKRDVTMSAKPLTIGDITVPLGERRDAELMVSESYSGVPVLVPVTVWRATEPGPTVFVSAAVHGDELNGTGIVRELLLNPPFELAAGSLILVPVVNMLGLERHQRYLPDRRDLNRSFPGDTSGSLARRFAHAFFEAVVKQCDYGIDLHTAAVRRTNFPNVRADLSIPEVNRLALALGSEFVIKGQGPKGSLRRSACAAGCPTVILEAGEVWKIEPAVVEFGVRCIRNALIELGIVEGSKRQPDYRLTIAKTKWIRAEFGGILQFHVSPGDIVETGQDVATNSDLHGKELRVIQSPVNGVVIGMTTLPVVTPGDAICHIAVVNRGLVAFRRARARVCTPDLHERLREDLSTSIAVTKPDEESGTEGI
jgi:predicted deacylase